MTTLGISGGRDNRPALGFTLIELLAVLGTLMFVLSVVATVHGRTRPAGQVFQCLSNTKRLMVANMMYQMENSDLLPMSFHGGYTPTATDPNRPWALGWLDWGTGSDNTNLSYLTDTRYAVLAPFLGRDTNVYKCPADVFVSPAQLAQGWTARSRSISANLYVGKGNAWSSGSGYTAGGPNNLTIYKGAAKSSDLQIPGPSRTWVYMDEHPDSMNDPGGFPPDSATNIPDAPATYHEGAAGFAMADGHSEIHKWVGPLMNRTRDQRGLLGVNFSAANNWSTVRGDPDLFWYSFSSPRITTRTVAD